MGQTVTTESLAKTMGLVPRYVRERQGAGMPETARPAAPPAAPVVPEAFVARRCDAITADLRRRIAGAKPPRRLSLKMATPAFAAVLLALRVLPNN